MTGISLTCCDCVNPRAGNDKKRRLPYWAGATTRSRTERAGPIPHRLAPWRRHSHCDPRCRSDSNHTSQSISLIHQRIVGVPTLSPNYIENIIRYVGTYYLTNMRGYVALDPLPRVSGVSRLRLSWSQVGVDYRTRGHIPDTKPLHPSFFPCTPTATTVVRSPPCV